MKRYNLIEMMKTIGYTERGAKCIITKKKKELGLLIEDYRKVSNHNITGILYTTLSPKKFVPLIVRMGEFLNTENESPSEDVILKDNHNTMTSKYDRTQEEDLKICTKEQFANLEPIYSIDDWVKVSLNITLGNLNKIQHSGMEVKNITIHSLLEE